MFGTESKEPIIVVKSLPVRNSDLFNIIPADCDEHMVNAKIIHRDKKVIVFLDEKGTSLSFFVDNKELYTITCTAEDAKVGGVLDLSTMKYTRNKNDFKNVLKPLSLGDEIDILYNDNGEDIYTDMKLIFVSDDKIVGVVEDVHGLKDEIAVFSKSLKSDCCAFEIDSQVEYKEKTE
jgi:hypothetical protein